MPVFAKPLILITSGGETAPNGLFRRQLFHTYPDAVQAAGGIPVLHLGGGADADDLARRFDGLLLSGGGDIAPERYGEPLLDCCSRVEPERDAREFSLLEAFCQAKKPVLGICRGIQVQCVFFGGTLWQDLPTQCGCTGHDAGTHEVQIEPGSLLFNLLGGRRTVNSLHHQAVKAPGEVLRVTARAPDGVVEGLEHPALPLWGVQWHPERQSDMAALFDRFIAQCNAKGGL